MPNICWPRPSWQFCGQLFSKTKGRGTVIEFFVVWYCMNANVGIEFKTTLLCSNFWPFICYNLILLWVIFNTIFRVAKSLRLEKWQKPFDPKGKIICLMRKVFWEVVVVVILIQENILKLNMEKGKFTFVYLYVFINQECGHS